MSAHLAAPDALATIFARTGDIEKARQQLQKALQAAPDHQPSRLLRNEPENPSR